MSRVWDKYLTERDQAVLKASGFGADAGFGERPALLVIDVNWAFCGDRPEPILESIKHWRHSCGEEAWLALGHLKQLIAKAHEKSVPVIYTTGFRRTDNWDLGSWSRKNSRAAEQPTVPGTGVDGNVICAEIAPGPRDIVIPKQKPSAFYGTYLASYLQLLRCDTVVVTGTTTSGCVRATVLDAFSQNYYVSVVEEGCFDRTEASHAINLFDMNSKYADVVRAADVLSYFDRLPPNLFDLPFGDNVASSVAAE